MPGVASPEPDLKGNTLRVYTFLFKVQKTGIREVQRQLGFKSPSLAQYHLDKLVSLGLAGRDETGDYVLIKEVKIEALEQFLKIGSYLVPRFILYSVTLSILFVYFVVYIHLSISTASVWGYIFGAAGLVITWYETIRLWRRPA